MQPAFYLAGNRARNGVAKVVAFKNWFTLETCFQVVFKHNALVMINCIPDPQIKTPPDSGDFTEK